MIKEAKVTAILPALNASKTLDPFLKSFPKDQFDEIILVDDCSEDDTYQLARKQKNITVFKNPNNLGYGGNLKMCLGLALERGAEVIVEIHPDGEYGFDGILPALNQIKRGAKLVLGNRFSDRYSILKNGMYFWKYLATRVLTIVDNFILGTKIPDMHQGFRVYTREFLENINYQANSNNYIFSFEIISQAVFFGFKTANIPMATRYTGKKRGASLPASIFYTLGTFKILGLFILAKLGMRSRLFSKDGEVIPCPNCQLSYLVEYVFSKNRFDLYFCKICQNGFTYPVPKNLSSYYPKVYWNYQGFLGFLRRVIFNFFQKRREEWLEEYLPDGGKVLDIGSGEGYFAKSINEKYHVVSLEASFAKLSNKKVITTDFLKWKTNKKFDAICFWESLEHTPKPQDYLNKAHSLLREGGLIFIEYPRYQVWESKLFGKKWFHLDFPRHIVQLTDQGLGILVLRVGFIKVVQQSIFAYDYAPGGFFLSMFNTRKFLNLLVLFPFLILSLVTELLLYILGQSPIGLMVAKKD